MPNTPTYGHPYPASTGKVAAGATNLQQLAESTEARDLVDSIVQIEEAESGSTAPGAGELVHFPGLISQLGGFTFDGTALIYSGTRRPFIVYAQVEVETAMSGDSAASSVACRQNYVTAPIASSYDASIVPAHAEDPTQTIRRKVTHSLCFPVMLDSGNVLQFVASSSPGVGTVGIVALRVFPIGPEQAS